MRRDFVGSDFAAVERGRDAATAAERGFFGVGLLANESISSEQFSHLHVAGAESVTQDIDGAHRFAIPTHKHVKSGVAAFWPGMDADMTFRQYRDAAHPLRRKFV